MTYNKFYTYEVVATESGKLVPWAYRTGMEYDKENLKKILYYACEGYVWGEHCNQKISTCLNSWFSEETVPGDCKIVYGRLGGMDLKLKISCERIK